jgi:hypothetical protein
MYSIFIYLYLYNYREVMPRKQTAKQLKEQATKKSMASFISAGRRRAKPAYYSDSDDDDGDILIMPTARPPAKRQERERRQPEPEPEEPESPEPEPEKKRESKKQPKRQPKQPQQPADELPLEAPKLVRQQGYSKEDVHKLLSDYTSDTNAKITALQEQLANSNQRTKKMTDKQKQMYDWYMNQ